MSTTARLPVERAAIAQTLYCPFPQTVNPHRARAQERSIQWLREHRLLEDEKLEAANRAGLAWMSAGFYPHAGLEQLSFATDYLSWIFALDDLGDETPVGMHPARLSRLLERFEEILEGTGPRSDAGSRELALWSLRVRLSRLASPAEVERFCRNNVAYFGGMLWEANNRAQRAVPDEAALLALRPSAGAVPPFFGLIRPLESVELSESVAAHEGLLKLATLAGGIVCWINDVLSYNKERPHGDVHNLVVVYEYHRGLDVTAALSEAVRFTNERVREFVAICSELPSFGEEEDVQVKRYYNALQSFVRTTLDFTLRSARYA